MASYREADRGEQARCVRLDALTPETQERLRRACLPGSEALLLADSPVSSSMLGLAGGALVVSGLAAAAAVFRHGFGSLEGRWPVMASGLGGGVGLGLAFLGLVTLSRAIQRLEPRQARWLRPGVYLLVHALVDARAEAIRIFPTNLLKQIRSRHGRLRFTFAGGEVVEMDETRPAADLGRALEAAQRRAVVAAATGDVATVSKLDPFEAQRHWPTDVARPKVRSTPWMVQTAIALAAGLVTGSLAARPLDRLSDEAGLRQAAAAGDDLALREGVARGGALAEAAEQARFELARRTDGDGGLLRYLTTGGRQREEALAEMLARLERAPTEAGIARYLEAGGPMSDQIDALRLRMALDQRSSGALRAYLAQGGRRGDEVQRRLLPRQRLREAMEAGDVSEMRDLALLSKGEVDPAVVTEAGEALGAIYRRAREMLRQRVGEHATPLTRLLDTMLASAETSHHIPYLQLTLSYSEPFARRPGAPYFDASMLPVTRAEAEERGLSDATARGLAGALAPLVEPRLLPVGTADPATRWPGRPSHSPVPIDVTPLHVSYGSTHYHGYYYTIDFELTLPDRSVASFVPHCMSYRNAFSQVVEHALAESFAGHVTSCPRSAWSR